MHRSANAKDTAAPPQKGSSTVSYVRGNNDLMSGNSRVLPPWYLTIGFTFYVYEGDQLGYEHSARSCIPLL